MNDMLVRPLSSGATAASRPSDRNPPNKECPDSSVTKEEPVLACAPASSLAAVMEGTLPSDSCTPDGGACCSAVLASISSQPVFTPREEELEWASVTPDEMLRIESDLRGLNLGDDVGIGRKATVSGVREDDGKKSSSASIGSAATTATGVNEREEALLPSMEEELRFLADSEKEAYLEAAQRCPELIDDEHKKAFLFREGFDPKLAAKRLATHWEYKRQLFGPDKCFQPMTLSGAMRDDIDALSEGFFRLVPAKDDHGRYIILMQPSRLYRSSNCTRESVMRVFCYLISIISADPADRRRGFIFLVYPQGASMHQFDRVLKSSVIEIMANYAVTVARSTHLCQPDIMFHLINPVAKQFMGEAMRKRFRVHYGSTDDVLRSLAEYGLGRDQLPAEVGGSLQLDTDRWLSERMLQEQGVDGIGDLAGVATAGADFASMMERMDSPCSFSELSTEEDEGSTSGPTEKVCDIMAARRVWDRETRQGVPSGNATQDRRKTREPNGDPRMTRAIDAKLAHPNISPYEALIAGGFCFPDFGRKGMTEGEILDADDGISLRQRKNQLRRRLRARRMDDPRIVRAAEAKRENPGMSLEQALMAGGFQFSGSGSPDKQHKGDIGDGEKELDNVPLRTRKAELINKMAQLAGVNTPNGTAGTTKVDERDKNVGRKLQMQAETIYDGTESSRSGTTEAPDQHDGTSLCDASKEQGSTIGIRDSFAERISNIVEPPESYEDDIESLGSEEDDMGSWLLRQEENPQL